VSGTTIVRVQSLAGMKHLAGNSDLIFTSGIPPAQEHKSLTPTDPHFK
jgi:hypothetical protein